MTVIATASKTVEVSSYTNSMQYIKSIKRTAHIKVK
jgi:hypothetical protein